MHGAIAEGLPSYGVDKIGQIFVRGHPVADFLAGAFATAAAYRVQAPSYWAFVSLDCYSAHIAIIII